MKKTNPIRLFFGIALGLLSACTTPAAELAAAVSQPPQNTLYTNPADASAQISQETEIAEIPMEKNNGNADVTFVRAIQGSNGAWTFHVTINHPDTGWEDYADGWDVLLEDGTVLKPDASSPFTRLLLHPHVGEQPFTRSQGGVTLPEGTTLIIVRAHDLIDGFGGAQVILDLTQPSGDAFTVERQP